MAGPVSWTLSVIQARQWVLMQRFRNEGDSRWLAIAGGLGLLAALLVLFRGQFDGERELIEYPARWLAAGHDGNLTTPEIALAVVTDKVFDGELMLEATHNFTLASIFPERPPVLTMADLSLWLKTQVDAGFKHAALIGSGTFLLSANLFILELFKVASKLVAEDALLAGHIMHRN